ncbi:MAG: RNA methyltransferase [Bacteroidetes bacterium]|nr:RNA methyltransferase [Bacteroidota bacterium]
MDSLNRQSVEEFRKADKFPVIAVFENVRSAYNVGSLFRTADAFKIQSVFLTGYTAQPPHKEIKKTALGAEDSVNWMHFNNAEEAILFLRNEGYRIYAAEQTTDSISLETFDVTNEKVAVIFGNEVSGVEQSTIMLCDGSIEIPQFGTKHSLNIASAAAVVLWELIRSHIVKK